MPIVGLDAIRPLRAFLDPSGGQATAGSSRLKKIASSAALVIGGRDDRNYYILDAWSARCSTDAIVEKMFWAVDHWGVIALGGEANALQGLFLDSVLREAKWRGKHLPLVKVVQPTNQHKDYRIRTALQPLVGHGRLVVRDTLTDLIDQLTAFPLSPHKDLVDACASLVRFFPPRPARQEQTAELAAKLRYLRASGVAPDILAAVAAGKDPGHAPPRPH